MEAKEIISELLERDIGAVKDLVQQSRLRKLLDLNVYCYFQHRREAAESGFDELRNYDNQMAKLTKDAGYCTINLR